MFVATAYGVGTDLLYSVYLLVSRRAHLLRLVAPVLVSLALFPFVLAGAMSYRPWFEALVTPGFWPVIMGWVAGGVSLIVALFCAGVAGAVITILLSGIFLESLVTLVLREEGFSIPEEKGVAAQAQLLLRSLIDQGRVALLLLAMSAISLVFSFVPVMLPAIPVLAAASMGIVAFDLPLALLGRTFKQRLALLKSHPVAVLTLGAIGAIIFVIPGLSMVGLAVGHVTAVLQIRRWELSKISS